MTTHVRSNMYKSLTGSITVILSHPVAELTPSVAVNTNDSVTPGSRHTLTTTSSEKKEIWPDIYTQMAKHNYISLTKKGSLANIAASLPQTLFSNSLPCK